MDSWLGNIDDFISRFMLLTGICYKKLRGTFYRNFSMCLKSLLGLTLQFSEVFLKFIDYLKTKGKITVELQEKEQMR